MIPYSILVSGFSNILSSLVDHVVYLYYIKVVNISIGVFLNRSQLSVINILYSEDRILYKY